MSRIVTLNLTFSWVLIYAENDAKNLSENISVVWK